MRVTNRMLAENLGLSHHRVRRWAKEFLPPDPRAGLRSGYAKHYSLNDGFKIVLGGHLVSSLGFTVYDAKRILKRLWPWIERNGLCPEFKGVVQKDKYTRVLRYEVHITKTENPPHDIIFEFNGTIDKKIEFRDDYAMLQEKKIIYVSPGAALNILPMAKKMLAISVLLVHYMERILNEEDFVEWKSLASNVGVAIQV